MAAAVVAAAHERGLSVAEPEDFRSLTGRGVTGEVNGRLVALGNAKLMRDLGISLEQIEAAAEPLRNDGATALFLAIDGKAAAVLAIADPIKPTTADALRRLKALGLRIVMLTGDNRTTAEAVARRLDIDEVVAEVLPADKHDLIRRLKERGPHRRHGRRRRQ